MQRTLSHELVMIHLKEEIKVGPPPEEAPWDCGKGRKRAGKGRCEHSAFTELAALGKVPCAALAVCRTLPPLHRADGGEEATHSVAPQKRGVLQRSCGDEGERKECADALGRAIRSLLFMRGGSGLRTHDCILFSYCVADVDARVFSSVGWAASVLSSKSGGRWWWWW
jgi:hypothetical protein